MYVQIDYSKIRLNVRTFVFLFNYLIIRNGRFENIVKNNII